MYAGLELDKLIAEKVMGLTEADLEVWDDHRGNTNPLPYSLEIKAAEDILYKFESFAMKWNIDEPVFIVQVQFEGNWYVGQGFTMPFAICMAALEAFKVKTR